MDYEQTSQSVNKRRTGSDLLLNMLLAEAPAPLAMSLNAIVFQNEYKYDKIERAYLTVASVIYV